MRCAERIWTCDAAAAFTQNSIVCRYRVQMGEAEWLYLCQSSMVACALSFSVVAGSEIEAHRINRPLTSAMEIAVSISISLLCAAGCPVRALRLVLPVSETITCLNFPSSAKSAPQSIPLGGINGECLKTSKMAFENSLIARRSSMDFGTDPIFKQRRSRTASMPQETKPPLASAGACARS